MSKKYLVIGKGKTGLALAEYFTKHNVLFTLYDDKTDNLEDALSHILDYCCVIISPAVKPSHPLVKRAQELHLSVVSEVEFAYKELKRINPSAKIIGVTGTNGKTTIVGMLGTLIGSGATMCGNVGVPFISVVESGAKVYVVELSSYQLNFVCEFKPDIAIISNIKPDHLAYHGTFANYISAKLNLVKKLKSDDVFITSGDDELLCKLIFGKTILCSTANQKADACIIQNQIVLSNGEKYSLEKFKLIGEHNKLNLMMSIVGARLVGVSATKIQERIENVMLEDYRIQNIGNFDGITVINDSKSTNVASTIACLNCFSDNVILLLGGLDKGEDLSLLFENIYLHKVKHYIFYGASKDKFYQEALKAQIGNFTVSLGDFKEAVREAVYLAGKGDTIILSPAGASFDMFLNYEDRGAKFNKIIFDSFIK